MVRAYLLWVAVLRALFSPPPGVLPPLPRPSNIEERGVRSGREWPVNL